MTALQITQTQPLISELPRSPQTAMNKRLVLAFGMVSNDAALKDSHTISFMFCFVF